MVREGTFQDNWRRGGNRGGGANYAGTREL